jgi:hypothetical protein
MIFVVRHVERDVQEPAEDRGESRSRYPRVIATCPSMLNQPVNQDHAGTVLPASFADQ